MKLKGTNELILNEQTVVEAVQEWLDRRTLGDPIAKVDSVCMVDESGPNTFKVVLEEVEGDGS